MDVKSVHRSYHNSGDVYKIKLGEKNIIKYMFEKLINSAQNM